MKDMGQLLAAYQVVSVEKYGGGLTGETTTKSRIGQTVGLAPGTFERGRCCDSPTGLSGLLSSGTTGGRRVAGALEQFLRLWHGSGGD